jgi:hypothetical protein
MCNAVRPLSALKKILFPTRIDPLKDVISQALLLNRNNGEIKTFRPLSKQRTLTADTIRTPAPQPGPLSP